MNTDYTPTRPADFDYDAALSKFSEDIRRKAKVQKLIAYFQEEESRLYFAVEDRKKDYDAEQADVAATMVNLMGYEAPAMWDESIIEVK